MKKFILTLSLLLSATAAQAVSDNTEFYSLDNSADSQLCMIAATQGYQAALAQGKEFGGKYIHFTKDTQCNGMSIKAFAKTHFKQNVETSEKQVSLFAGNHSQDSQLCLQAAKSGLAAVAKKSNVKNLKCNGVAIKQFVKQVHNI